MDLLTFVDGGFGKDVWNGEGWRRRKEKKEEKEAKTPEQRRGYKKGPAKPG